MEGRLILRKLPVFLGILLVLVIGSFVGAYGWTRYTARNAEILLADLQTIRLNASLADAQRFIDGHAGAKEVKCTDPERTECELVIRLNNRWLAKLHLVPPTEVAAAFTVSRGRVFRMAAAIVVHKVIPGTFSVSYSAGTTEQLFDPESGIVEPIHVSHKLAHNAPDQFIPLFVTYWLDERAKPEQRKLAYSSLNVSCLYKLGGCKDAEALAPSAWTAADKVGWHDETNIEQMH